MRVKNRSHATVAFALLLLGSVMLSFLLMMPQSNQDVTQLAPPIASQVNQIPSHPAQVTATATSLSVVTPVTQLTEPPIDPVNTSDVLSISGSVLDQQGKSLANIEIIAIPQGVFNNADTPQVSEQSTITDTDGYYRFTGLVRGEYRLRTVETSLFSSKSVSVRAPGDAVDLVLAHRQELWIYGTVENRSDEPLAGVLIVPDRKPENTSYSDSEGNFGFSHSVHGNAQYLGSLHFSFPGYHDKRVVLRTTDLIAKEVSVATVRLEPIAGQANVSGHVSADDAPVRRARVFLRSTKHMESYHTRTDASGYFALPDVVLGQYEITVVPQGRYQDYSESGIVVAASGRELLIALEPLQIGRLRGQMIDVRGQPVPNFSLWLSSLSARGRGSRPLKGDVQGYFEVGSLAVGKLRLATHSAPRIHLNGVQVSSDDDLPVRLVLDVGNHVLEGEVVDHHANPVPGAQLSLHWTHNDNGISGHALRNSSSDANGYFRFTQLGPGVHTLNVSAPGFQHRRLEHDVSFGGEITIKLQPLVPDRVP